MIYLTLPELVHIAERTLGGDVVVRDHGLLESASARPQATVFGADAYGSVEEKLRRCYIPWPATMPWWTETSDWPWQRQSHSSVSTGAA